jgi:hypothetical protein
MKMFVRHYENEYGGFARCGVCLCDVEFIECEQCGGEGVDGHGCGDDICVCLNPIDNIECDTCDGHGGWWYCDTCKKSTNILKKAIPGGGIEA